MSTYEVKFATISMGGEHEGREDRDMTEEQKAARVYHHLYVDSKIPLENAERIVALEELVLDLWPRAAFTMTEANRRSWLERMAELGL